ncbi:MAG TPA: hypothetical protein VM123_17125 [archaeon]|nr:hypothetical protein [archaeon]
MAEEKTTTAQPVSEAFTRKVVNVRKVFRDALNRHLVDGKISNKEKLEQDKLKISASLVNFVVAGGVLLFEEEKPDKAVAAGLKEKKVAGLKEHEEQRLQEVEVMDEAALFHLLRVTILMMLKELNNPEVNLLKISLSKSFRATLQSIFSVVRSAEPDHFPVKIFHDMHQNQSFYIGINMRITRSLGDDIDCIERSPVLKKEIIELHRPIRHTDGNLCKILAPFPASPPPKSSP